MEIGGDELLGDELLVPSTEGGVARTVGPRWKHDYCVWTQHASYGRGAAYTLLFVMHNFHADVVGDGVIPM